MVEMEGCVSDLTTELLERTHRYLNAAGLVSFVLPLPFNDGNILDKRGLMVKILSNVTCIPKEQMYKIIRNLHNGSKSIESDHVSFSRAYDSAFLSGRTQRTTKNSSSNARGIRSALRLSAVSSDHSLISELSGIHSSETIANKLLEVLHNTYNPLIVGFVMIIGSKKGGRRDLSHVQTIPFIPLAGAIVELLDPEEHCIRAIWCDPSLPPDVEADFSKVLILRTLGHAFDYGYPGTSTPQRLKHISILNVHGVLFPRSIYTFVIDSLKFGKHFETGDNGGSHEDSASNPCRCFKLANSSDSELFWGISESRLRGTYNSIRSKIPNLPSDGAIRAFGIASF